ncbi:gliding motility-associated C-terminal domain-containing protein [Flavobacterium sp. MMS24-S5]|uniref:Ig-like domain-containing protein n=1 Tax=Flavobacterium sp. MMS24-S5 TaxID=3416605 RepID=UPI003D08D8A8
MSGTQTTCTAPTGTITVNTPANGSGISYTLTGTNPVSASVNSTTGIFSGLVPGTYSVTTTNAQGCTSAANTGIVINAVAGAPTATGVTICQDGSGSLTATSPCGTSNSSGAKIARAGNSVGTASLSWSNPSRVNSNDSSYASATVSSGGNITVVTRSLQGTDFDFNIPSNATITGIQVTIGRYSSTASSTVNVKDNVVSLIKAGTVIGENKSITGSNWPISSTSVANYGGSSDLWNTTWTPADINNANFGIALSASITRTSNNDITAYVDYMQITVNYTIGGIEWYTTSTGGSSIYTGTSFNPVGVTGSGLTSTATATTKTYYAACSGNSNCRAAVNFVVNAKPTIATITSNSRCGAGEVTLEATASAGTINWYAAATGGTSLGTGESFTTPSLSTSTSYYVDATENGCTTPTRTEVKATINTVPTINSTTEGSICGSGSVKLTATASTGSTINWYADPTSSTVLGTGTTFNTPTLTATTTYYVGAVTSSGCTSTSRIAVAAVINKASSIVFTSGTQNPTVCSGASVPNAVYTFGGSATNATVSNLPTGLSAAVDTNAKTVTISGNPTSAGTYIITTVGHTAPCAEVTIQGTVTLTPNVAIASFSPATSSRCQGVETITRTTTATNSTGGIIYSLDSASSTGGNTINSTTGAVTYVAGWSGTTTITASAAGCNEQVTTTHTVTTNALPTATISGNLTACLTTTLTANSNASSATYVWYKNNVAIPSQISSTLVVNSDGDYKVKIKNSSTGCEATSAASTVKVSDTEKPVKPVLADITAECSVTVTAPTTTDNCKGTVTGTTTDPLTYSTQGTYTINWSFSDGNGNIETATQKVIIKDTQKPVKPTLADITGECSATATPPTTTDNCAGTVTGTTTDPLTYNAQGTYTINWSFSDGNGNVETATQKVVIKDTQKPVKPTLADITGECSATATAPTTTDNCAGTVTGTTTDPLTYNAQGTYTINWSFSDGNGNVETATQKVIIKDTQKPVKPTLADITGECSATATAPTTTDNCKGTVTGTTTDPLTYNAQGTYTINWSFSDGNGNVETASQKVIIKDTQKPVKPTLADITGECSATATAPTTTDNCKGTVTGTTTDPLTYNTQGTYTINWSFSDGNGNVETATQKVIVKDTQKPSITCPLGVSVSTDANSCTATGVVLGTPTVSDNCSGTITVTNDAPSSFPIGNTTVTWTATDAGGNTETCTQIVKVIGEITANDDSVSSSNGVAGGVVITNVFDNDVLNCNKVNRGDVDVTVNGTVPSVLIFNAANGAVSVKPNTPTGTYTFDYSICEIANSGNCNTATVEVEIVNDLIAVKDDFGTKTSGSSSAIVGNVKSNDTLDGASVTSANTVVTAGSDGPLSVDADGDVTLAANTPSGSYSITYEICEKDANPSNCKTATAEVKVENGLIAVKDDFGTKTSGSASAIVGNVKSNDTLDGASVTSGNTVVTIDSNGPLSVDADGDVTLAANTPSGSYSITYEICEKGANPSNCKTATAEVKVENGLIAVKDDFGTKTSGSTAAIVGNVKSNDTLDGASVTSVNTVVTIDSDEPLSVDADGDVTLAANTPSGSYSITYEICEKGANPSNCKTATAEVKVENGLIAVKDDFGTKTSGSTAAVIGNVKSNDTLDGASVTSVNTVVTIDSNVALSVDANGDVTLAANTPSGTYSITYEICEKGANPSNCKTAIAEVKVENGLIAVKDDFGTKTSGSTAAVIGNVKSNDTLDGASVTSGNTVVTIDSNGPLSVDADGDVTLAANTPSGTYSITYEICEKGANPSNCKTAIAEVKVENGLIAVKDDFGTKTSGSASAIVGNVKSNDTLDGASVTSGNTIVTIDSDGPLSVDANGDVTLAANTPSGSYSITYEICEKNANPSNCKTATAEVKVENGLIAVKDDFGTKTSGSTAAVIGNVKSNDTLDGASVTSGNTVVTIDSDGPLSVDADGDVTLAANTPSGSYSITYEICEKGANPSNCKTATAEVKVENGLIAVKDDFGTKTSGSTAAIVGNVKSNDTLDGASVTSVNTVVTIDSNVALSVDANGDVTLAANTPSGSYSITYEICEKGANPSNCKTTTAEVKVVNTIDAVLDTITPINGNIGGTTVSLIGNDTLNGDKAVIGTNSGEVTINIVGTLPSGLTLNTNGTITVASGTPKGDYKVEYTICEVGAVPANCDSVTITVPVTAGNLVANADEIPSVLGSDAPQTLGKNVFDNDTKNAQPLDPADVTLKTTSADPKGYLTVDADGKIILGANPPAGDYELTYEICEKLNPDNCSSNIVKVTVGLPVIDAVEDTVSPINGNIGGKTISLTANDKLNGSPITVGTAAGEVKFEIIGTLPTGLTLNSDYTISVAPNTPKGDYKVEYKICENTNPLNCDSVTITVPVTAGNLVANADEIPSVLGSDAPQTLGKNVFDNDTKNAQPLDPADVTLKTTAADPKGYLTVDADGKIILGANPPAGDYELTYEICEKLNLDNCSSNTVKVTVVLPVIDAVEDVIASINGNIGGKTISLTANDKLNGSPITVGTAAGEVKFEIIGTLPSGLTLNSDYTISVAPNTPKGDYKVEYKICENTNPLNCDSVTITVPVTAGNLVANADEIPSVLGSDAPQTLGKNVFDNDTKNGQPLDPSDVTLKTTSADPKGYLTVDADGKIILGANPPAGDYELTYEICEKLNPDNCSSNTVKVTVGLPVINAVEDTVSPINGNIGGKTISLTANDKLNGNPITVGTAAGEVKFEIIGTLPSGLTLNSDYTISVAPNTPKGDYKVEYKICENTNPLNCDSVTITVPVTAGNLVANADEIPSVLGSNVPQTLGKNVFDNDTKNAQPLDPSDVTLKTTSADPKGYLTVDADGKIILGANPPAGDYELTYEICEKLNPDNCSSNTVKVTVGLPVIDAVEDVIASINGNIGGKTISLTANDKLNGSPITVGTAAGEVKFEIIGTLPSGLTLNSDYTISVAPNTPKGDYKVEYKICENTNPTNCDSVIITVPVTGGNLVANEDLMPSAVGVNIPQKVINVFENDTKDGNKLVPSEVDLKVTQEDPKGYLTVDADGNVVLAPNAPAGEYELTYTICEKLNPNNCDSNVVKVTVTEPKMAVTANSYCSNNVPYVNYSVSPENFTTNNLLTVKWIDSNNNVVATQTNLPLSGNILWPGAEVDSNKNGTDWPGWILNNGIWSEGADGFEATRNGVKIEFSLNPTVTVSVAYPPATPDCNAHPTFSIKANNDETGPVNVKKGANATVNIFLNDLLNGAQIKPSDVILSIPVVNPNFSLNENGSVNIAANTPDGIYELTYQICEAANTSNCSQAVIKITVDNVADPAPPTENQITLNNDNDVSADGINGSLEFVNVLENDLINGKPINPADVTIKPLTESPYFEWNADGTVNVKPNTPGGNYPLTYQVCEKANSSNCSTATLNVFVEVPAISVIKTAVFNDENKSGFANAGETITYKFTVTNTGNVPLVGITINDPLPGVVVSGQAINLGVNESNETNFTAVYKITQEDINRGSVSNQATVKGSSVRGVVVEDQSDDASNSGDSPTVLDLNGCSIKVMNAFSPNGDSKNARFYIRGIECYPDNTVEIYNRWGVLVFSIDQYNNNDRVFEGYSNGRSTIKQTDGLPVGTYFYILKYKDSAQKSHQESGYLYLNK